MTDQRDTFEIGVDIGGTFTDIVAFGGPAQALFTAKVLTDYQDLARGVITGVDQILSGHGIAPAQVTRVVHGTTLVTNSLIERRGAKTALLVTEGFGDVLEFGRESRFDIYDINIEITPPLVPRELVFEVPERLDWRGNIVSVLKEETLQSIAQKLQREQVKSVAVCLLHSYANAVHERRIAELLAASMPGIEVCLSCDVMSDAKEYERASTTVANAYVKPVMEAYLHGLSTALGMRGIKASLLIMTSDGGLVDVATATRFPVRLIESGPAGGAAAAAYVGRNAGVSQLLAYDMGGTTAKLCLIEDGTPVKADQFEFGRSQRFAKGSGLPLQIPVIEMIEIGAGGGSIALVNDIGMLQIGPQSANAAPGPACYGLGGQYATVTDADLVLGYVSGESFLGGTMPLHTEHARSAIDIAVAQPLNLSIDEAAWSIHRVVNANMARAAKVHCLEQGVDVREFALFAYGGAGPIHAYGVAQILGVRHLIYPLRAGVLSAFGFLVAESAFEIVHGSIEALDTLDCNKLNSMLTDLGNEATEVVAASVPADTQFKVTREVALRYKGQSFELYQAVPAGPINSAMLAAIDAGFAARYGERYRARVEQGAVETVRWKVRASALENKRRPHLGAPVSAETTAQIGQRRVWVPEQNTFADCPVFDRYRLHAQATIVGPAIFEEPESTVFIGQGAKATVDANGALRVDLPERSV
jgi:N-methylhydantoinase A